MVRKRLKTVLVILGIVTLAAVGSVWNEARKEVVFLCANFTPGVPEESVIRQLETGHFLRYRDNGRKDGAQIIVDSAYTLGVYNCVIDLDTERVVVRARVE
jgi:hypothetical protein